MPFSETIPPYFTDKVWICEGVDGGWSWDEPYSGNVFGAPATIYSVTVKNLSGGKVFVKLYDFRIELKNGVTTPVPSELRTPKIQISCGVGQYTMNFPGGISLTRGLCVRATQLPIETDVTSPAGGDVTVQVVAR